jgi:hypothetical protein
MDQGRKGSKGFFRIFVTSCDKRDPGRVWGQIVFDFVTNLINGHRDTDKADEILLVEFGLKWRRECFYKVFSLLSNAQ